MAQLLWNHRFAFAGQVPATYPGLNPVALGRLGQGSGAGRYRDGLDSDREWVYESDGTPVNWTRSRARTGNMFRVNLYDPASEQGRLELQHFDGLWPAGGRLLVGMWVWQRYIMDFNPLMDTRATDPLLYLSTFGGTGTPRLQVYSAGGSLLLDESYSSVPWAYEYDEPYYLGALVDLDEGTAQLFSVQDSTGETWTGPEWTFSGTPNLGCTANLDLFSLRASDFWEAGNLAEPMVAHPSSSFDLQNFVDDMGHSVHADAQDRRSDQDLLFDVDEDGVHAVDAGTFTTGAELVEWPARPTFDGDDHATPYLSDDGGETWEEYSTGSLPSEFDGLLRWEVTLPAGESFTGVEVTVPDAPDVEVTPEAPEHDTGTNEVTVSPQTGVIWSTIGVVELEPGDDVTVTAEPEDGYTFPTGATTSWTFEYAYPDEPELEPLQDIVLQQGELVQVELEGTASGPQWSVDADPMLEVALTDGVLHLAAGFDVGDSDVTVTLTDQYGRSTSETFTAEVEPRTWDEGEPPAYPHTPIIVWDDDGPAAVLIDPLEAWVTNEINGSHTFELRIPARHKHARLIRNERVLQVAGEKYWVRRAATKRAGRRVLIEVYAEARFYSLATAGEDEVPAAEWEQVSAGRVMEYALEGTGWSVDTANVSTRRTYETEAGNPLEILRSVQEQHGGDLVFNNEARTVSLVVQHGRDKGVSFFHGRGLSDSKRTVDTTSLVTRLYAKNEDGLTIESVNGGVPYVEDYRYTDEVRTATYKFKAGTSPNTMLSMARATLANRCEPDYSYEVSVSDLSAQTGDDLDRFDAGDIVTVVDHEIGLEESQRIVQLEYNIIRPWATQLTLSARLRETSDGDSGDADQLETGSTVDTFDLVPFNLLLNGRFDNGLNHWANDGAEVVDGGGTGDYAVRFEGPGERWIEQTVQPDNREAFAFSFDLDTSGPSGWEPDLTVEAVITYEDGETETIELDLS